MTQAEPPSVVFLDMGSFTIEPRRGVLCAPHRWTAYAHTAPEQVSRRLAGASVAMTNGVALSAEQLAPLRQLRLIAACATGLDHIDLAFCQERGIAVTNVSDYATHTVAEHVFALILALKRSLAGYLSDQAAGAWQASGQYSLARHPISELHGGQLGIIGGGAIGQAVARIGRGFGMTPRFAARKGAPAGPERVPFEELLADSDVISLHCPLTPETRGLIDAAAFARMARRPILINAARGGVVEEAALVRALHDGQISGAGFDVASQEPIADGNPLLALRDDPRFILTPHVAWASREAQQALFDQALGQVERFLQSKQNCDHSS